MSEEYTKLEIILNKEWDKWKKADSGGDWFEIEHMIMSDNYGYSYTDDCEWIKEEVNDENNR